MAPARALWQVSHQLRRRQAEQPLDAVLVSDSVSAFWPWVNGRLCLSPILCRAAPAERAQHRAD